MKREKIIYEDEDITVTTRIITNSDGSYAIRNITSIKEEIEPPLLKKPMYLCLLGFTLIVIAIGIFVEKGLSNGEITFIVGSIMSLIGIVWLRITLQPRYGESENILLDHQLPLILSGIGIATILFSFIMIYDKGLSSGAILSLFGTTLIAIGFIWIKNAKTIYYLIITDSSGETDDLLISNNKEHHLRVKEAVIQAMQKHKS